MKVKDVPPISPPTTEGTLADLPRRNAAKDPGGDAFAKKDATGAWIDKTWARFSDEVDAIAKGFIASGVKPGDRIALMSRTRYEWTLVDFGAWAAGAVVVPVYETSSPEQVEWILSDSGASIVVVESAKHAEIIGEVRDRLPDLREVVGIDAGELDRLSAAGGSVSDDALAAATAGMDRRSVATLIYTSGTTGRPKGVELTHGNFLDLCDNAIEKLGDEVLGEGASMLLFLPLAHVLARFIEVLCVSAYVRMGHAPDIKTLLDDFASFKPTFVLAVPRVFEKIFNSAEAKAAAGGKERIFHRAATVAIAYSESLEQGGAGLGLKIQHVIFDRLVYGKLREAMGGRVRFAVSGGAPLGTRLGHFFRGIGVTILEGYGLTETTGPLSVNVPRNIKIGTVGPPLPGTAIRIADDGEVLVKGIGVFSAYHGNEQATSEAIRDGWFHTGDLGDLDAEGYLRITGRKKEILVTAGGKNVAPTILEDRLRAHPLVSQCIVVGDQKPFIGALITLDAEMWPLWASTHGLDNVSLDEARTHPKVLEALQNAVDRANEAVSKAESIRKFAVLSGDFTEGNGYLTPSLKMRRNIVMKDFEAEVDRLYS